MLSGDGSLQCECVVAYEKLRRFKLPRLHEAPREYQHANATARLSRRYPDEMRVLYALDAGLHQAALAHPEVSWAEREVVEL